jgi:hypothetical protein
MVGKPQIKDLHWFEKSFATALDLLSEVNPKLLKALVQKCGTRREEFENRLLSADHLSHAGFAESRNELSNLRATLCFHVGACRSHFHDEHI